MEPGVLQAAIEESSSERGRAGRGGAGRGGADRVSTHCRGHPPWLCFLAHSHAWGCRLRPVHMPGLNRLRALPSLKHMHTETSAQLSPSAPQPFNSSPTPAPARPLQAW